MDKKRLIIYVYEEEGSKPVAEFSDMNDATIFIDAKEKKDGKKYYIGNSDTNDNSAKSNNF